MKATTKQTAVEWLMQQLPTIEKYEPYYQDLFTQAKEMEKEQSHAEYMRGWKDGLTKKENFKSK